MKLLSLIFIVAVAASSFPDKADARNFFSEEGTRSSKIRMTMYGRTRPPIGHVRFCEQHRVECLRSSAANARVKMTKHSWEQLNAVNRQINKLIEPVSDEEQYGEIERWTYPTSGRGDCEDYVLSKKRELVRLGWPASALLITVVRDEFNEGHAVLTVRTDDGDFILDNKISRIVPWHKTLYFFIKRQSASDPGNWISLIPSHTEPTVSASGSE